MILGAAILNTNRLDPGLAEIQASSLPHVSCQIPGQRAAGMERAEGTSFAESVRFMDMGICLGGTSEFWHIPMMCGRSLWNPWIFLTPSLQDWLRGICLELCFCWCHPDGECDARAVEKFRDKEKEVCNPVVFDLEFMSCFEIPSFFACVCSPTVLRVKNGCEKYFTLIWNQLFYSWKGSKESANSSYFKICPEMIWLRNMELIVGSSYDFYVILSKITMKLLQKLTFPTAGSLWGSTHGGSSRFDAWRLWGTRRFARSWAPVEFFELLVDV